MCKKLFFFLYINKIVFNEKRANINKHYVV